MCDKINLGDISSNLLNLLMGIHAKIFNPDKMVKDIKLPPSHVKVLFNLSKNNDVSVSSMSSCLGISKSNMTPIIDKLISEGYVSRYNDEKDRRKINIKITDDGKKFLKEKREYFINSLKEILSTLEEEEQERLNELVYEMRTILDNIK